MAENRYHEGVLGESVARFHLHFGEREDENVNGEVLRPNQKKGEYLCQDIREFYIFL